MEEAMKKDPREKKCAICGKDIWAREDWAFKRRPSGKPTKWFCSYKHMREYDAKTEPKPKKIQKADTEPKAPKEPTSRAEQAKALAREILAGRSPIAWLKAEGYKNPHEAYSAVRHYAQTKMPELAETLKPLKELPKAKQETKKLEEMKRVDKVSPVEKAEEEQGAPEVNTGATFTQLVELNLKGGVDYQLKVDENRKTEQVDEVTLKQVFHLYTREDLLRIVDAAALKCQAEKCFRWGSDTLDQQMFHDARSNAVGVGVMKLRKEIRRMLGAEEEEEE